jgi:hypothetical protein
MLRKVKCLAKGANTGDQGMLHPLRCQGLSGVRRGTAGCLPPSLRA